jgi:hypothetical protein
MSVIMELFYGTQGRGKEKEHDRKSVILKYITSMQLEDTTICIDNC